ncbi:unnamed protein product [Clavelina lepadiformis]|uniref:Uncharacterized protein n=1 Tax=Clavelina lepadiformis TaxID=159417 RepID=A0ABP0F1Q7_CLALP
MNRNLYLTIRCLAGLSFVLYGCMTTDYVGKRAFPDMHKKFVKIYRDGDAAENIPWKPKGVEVTDDDLRQTIGYMVLISGALLILFKQFQLPCWLLLSVGVLSVYTHFTKNDPLYMILGGISICITMFILLFAKPEEIHEKTE